MFNEFILTFYKWVNGEDKSDLVNQWANGIDISYKVLSNVDLDVDQGVGFKYQGLLLHWYLVQIFWAIDWCLIYSELSDNPKKISYNL